MKPISGLASDRETLADVHHSVRKRLKEMGVVVKAQKRKVFPVTPGRQSSSSSSSTILMSSSTAATRRRVFGCPLRDMAPNTLSLEGSEIIVPHFLTSIIDYLNQHLDSEGLFRKSGSALRQKALQAEVEVAETFVSDESTSVYDASSLLKQWLRQLPEPLIPPNLHEAFIRSSSSVANEADKREAVLLCCLLLPPLHVSCLSLVVRFLARVADHKHQNRMDQRSLAIVFTPGLFSADSDAVAAQSKGSGNDGKRGTLAAQLDAVEIMIRNANKVGMIDEAMESWLQLPHRSDLSELNTASEDVDSAEIGSLFGAGPSERRRRQKKKRRSGSLSRVFSATMKGLHKAISRSTTPSATRSSSLVNVDDCSSASIPYQFSSPVVAMVAPAKKRASPAASPSLRKATTSLFETSFTPKVMRKKSISIKNRFRRKKSIKGGMDDLASTPLPSKPTLDSLMRLATPSTPASGHYLPDGVHDLSDRSVEAQPPLPKITTEESSIMQRSSVSVSSLPYLPVSSSASPVLPQHIQKSPGRRKIGQARQSRRPESSLSSVRSESETRIKCDIKPVLSLNDSLTNLSQEIHSLIDSSLGCNIVNAAPPVSAEQIRRQSSAFELSRPMRSDVVASMCMPAFSRPNVASSIRRQSSAFEIGTRSKSHISASSVKDLVMQLEAHGPFSKNKTADTGVDAEEDAVVDWVDANEFFNKSPLKSHLTHLDDEETGGCKRSSIIKIRKEKKGMVSKSVATFTRPAPPPPMTPAKHGIHRTPMRTPVAVVTGHTSTRRRASARMGVATTTVQVSVATSSTDGDGPTLRRQTLTGIKTTPSNTRRTGALVPSDRKILSASVATSRTKPSSTMNPSSESGCIYENVALLKELRRSKRLEVRRHKTIGYAGEEERSPLKEKQNVVITVQRSHSAQTPNANRLLRRALANDILVPIRSDSNEGSELPMPKTAVHHLSKDHFSTPRQSRSGRRMAVEIAATPRILPSARSDGLGPIKSSAWSSSSRKSPRRAVVSRY